MSVKYFKNYHKFLIANWKMYLSYEQSLDLLKQQKDAVKNLSPKNTVIICPSFPVLSQISQTKDNLFFGGQDISAFGVGAHTGDVSAQMLTDLGCDFVILGHSERRKHNGETDEVINLKIKQALVHNLVPIVCVGETAIQRNSGQEKEIVFVQLEKCFQDLKLDENENLIVAYEPIWAIGTGKSCSVEDAVLMHEYIRKILGDKFGNSFDEKRVRVVYGGSVNEKNIAEYFADEIIEGALVGGAGVKLDSWQRLIKIISAKV